MSNILVHAYQVLLLPLLMILRDDGRCCLRVIINTMCNSIVLQRKLNVEPA